MSIVTSDQFKMYLLENGKKVCEILRLDVDGNIWEQNYGDGIKKKVLDTWMETNKDVKSGIGLSHIIHVPKKKLKMDIEVLSCRLVSDGIYRASIRRREK